uniref:Uncharacterized protein n=1 Tax=Romanomermis culicivorax TaxID=13658 RepID=A0A915KGQ6_ROMCU
MFNTTSTNQKQFFDWIVVGLNNRDECRQRGNGDLQYLIDIPVNTEPCATRIIRPGLIENVIRIQQHPLLIVEGDEVITVRCDYNFPDIVLPPPVLRNAFPFTSGGGILNQESLQASTIVAASDSRLNSANFPDQKSNLAKVSRSATTFFGPTFIIVLLATLSAILLLICCCICFAYTRHKKRMLSEKRADENGERNAAVQLVTPRRLGNGRSMSHRSADSPTDSKMNMGGYLWWTGKLPVTRSHPATGLSRKDHRSSGHFSKMTALFDRPDDFTAPPSSNPEHLSISTGYPGGSTTPTTGSGSPPGGDHTNEATLSAVVKDQIQQRSTAVERRNIKAAGDLMVIQNSSASEDLKNSGYETALHPRSFIQAAGLAQVFTHKGRQRGDTFSNGVHKREEYDTELFESLLCLTPKSLRQVCEAHGKNCEAFSHDMKLRDPDQFNRILDEISNRDQNLLSQVDIDKLTILIRKNPKIRHILFEAKTFNDLSALKYLNDCKNLFDDRKWNDILKFLASVLKFDENEEPENRSYFHQNEILGSCSPQNGDFDDDQRRDKNNNNDSCSDKISSDRSTTEFIEFAGKIRKNDVKKVHRSGSLAAESGVIMFDDNMQISSQKMENSPKTADLNIYMGYLSESDLTTVSNHNHKHFDNREYLDGDYYANHFLEKSRFKGLSFKAL